ncbi:cGMP-dependent protein kinase, isozyme 1-like isoform X2 [Tigriopus californicus]|uniref:cGMP-dependent protein kinase, isozyme 1-like isoform X2 n=1 Tax=Tigriopus californicus TaxID=6832 RepID=UPI0027DA1D9B|nr:cGMP-dependent protein kinase, isozyme 1-like isoform X2 [Tigriopus californicus]
MTKSRNSDDADVLKGFISDLENELKDKSVSCATFEAEIRSLQRKLAKKDAEILKQQRELHKLKSVLQQASSIMSTGDDHLLTTIQEQYSMSGQLSLAKKQGVSGKSLDPGKSVNIPKVDKDFRSKQLIKEALTENDFLTNLSPSQMREVVDYMELQKVPAGSYVIREGDSGSHLYVSMEGEYEVIKEGKVLGRLGVGKAFGELAILYNCKRTASIKAITQGEVWALERTVFQQIMMATGMQKLQDQLKFLRTVPLLSAMTDDQLLRLSNAFEMTTFPRGSYIIRQGTSGDTFYIISEGKVKVTKRQEGKRDEEEIRSLSRGDYFGEQALLKTEYRTANVVADSEEVDCLAFDRESFFQLVGALDELRDKEYADERPRPRGIKAIEDKKVSKEYASVTLNDLEVIATLGVGGFGRVELVHIAQDKTKTYALKCLKKKHIVETQQQEHVFSEKRIMMNCNHQFIAKLFRTFRDRKYVYFLMEACLGGELWTILRDRGWFDDSTTRFYLACVISAVDYLHSRGIIYRDLKPENLLLDAKGYVKMVDFGFSKRINEGSKTWTFCGTPEYVAPEIILNKGHDRSVDFWSLGVLMCELLTGTPPFTANDPMKIYNIILRGIEQLEFPRHVTKTAIAIIKRFCRENPAERLGYQKDGMLDIKKHRWYQGFDWDGLEARTLTPPIISKQEKMSAAGQPNNPPLNVTELEEAMILTMDN